LAIRQSRVGEADFIPYPRIDEVSNPLWKQRLSQSRRGGNIFGVHTRVRQVSFELTQAKKRVVSETVLFETIFTLQRYYWVPTPQIKDLLLPTPGL
jgi:hypothetical protein